MSAHVRTVFRTAVTAAAVLPYFDTIGQVVDLNKVPDHWVTLEFPLVQAMRVALGFPACYRERGSVLVHVIGRSGNGDAAVFDYAEQIRPFFDRAYVDDVRMVGTDPPTLAPTDNGEWLDVILPVGYEWDYVIQGVTP